MSKIDKKFLKIKLYDTDSETETDEKRPASQTHSNSDGRVSRADNSRPSRLNSIDEDSRASSKSTVKINHFSRSKQSKQRSSSSSSNEGPKIRSPPSNSSYSDTSIRHEEKKHVDKNKIERPKSSKTPTKSSKSDSTSSNSSRASSTSDESSRRSSETERSDSDTRRSSHSQETVPIKVNIERKPPIYHKKKSPNADSEDEKHKKNDSDNSSDVTDVSPLPTPKVVNSKASKPQLPPSFQNHHRWRKNLTEFKDADRIDTSIFYDALNGDLNKKLSLTFANSRPASSKQGNYSGQNSLNQTIDLSNSSYGAKLIRLEAENQRLYEKLMRENKRNRRHGALLADKPVRLTSSALNRQREQQRIEKENQLILRRLLEVKPSRDVQKEHQMRDYERNFGYLSLKMLPVSSNTSFNRSAVSSKRPSAKSTANNSRVSSAKSGKTVEFDTNEVMKRAASLNRRPEWNERW